MLGHPLYRDQTASVAVMARVAGIRNVTPRPVAFSYGVKVAGVATVFVQARPSLSTEEDALHGGLTTWTRVSGDVFTCTYQIFFSLLGVSSLGGFLAARCAWSAGSSVPQLTEKLTNKKVFFGTFHRWRII